MTDGVRVFGRQGCDHGTTQVLVARELHLLLFETAHREGPLYRTLKLSTDTYDSRIPVVVTKKRFQLGIGRYQT